VTTVAPWRELLASALVGTERRPVHSGLSTVDDPAVALLDAAVARTVYRLAGVRPATGLAAPAPAPDDPTPLAGPAACSRLARLLESGPSGADGLDAQMRGELLAEWLTEAARAGRRVPGEVLPALLDAGRRSRDLRPSIVRTGGARAGWLAAQRPEWAYLTGERDDSVATDASWAGTWAEPASRRLSAWELGTPGQRVGYLAAARLADPDAARELLAAGWASEAPDQRATLLGTLRTGLSAADEEFLERALDDRRKEVRSTAAELLGQLPGSAYRQRMAARARACVRIEAGALVVEPPVECDTGMRRDGVAPKPPQGIGERAWWLEQVVARTPLATWTDADPAAFLALAVADGWEMVLLRGLVAATVSAGDGRWAGPLLDRLFAVGPWADKRHAAGLAQVPAHDKAHPDPELMASLVATVPDAELTERVVVLLHRDPSGGQGLDLLLMRCPRPWPPSLVDGLLATLGGPVERLGNTWRVSNLCRLAAARLPTGCVDRFAALAVSTREQLTELTGRIARAAALTDPGSDPTATAATGTGTAAGARGVDAAERRRVSAVQELARDLELTTDVLRFRHEMIEELQ
jgi:hypothetical protein